MMTNKYLRTATAALIYAGSCFVVLPAEAELERSKNQDPPRESFLSPEPPSDQEAELEDMMRNSRQKIQNSQVENV